MFYNKKNNFDAKNLLRDKYQRVMKCDIIINSKIVSIMKIQYV